MNNLIYVTGHKNPDTDSICAAITYADMKRHCGQQAVACRLGPLNDETKFVLKKFHQENPLLLDDARSTLMDIDLDQPTLIHKSDTCHQAWKEMLQAKNRSLFVVDEKEHLCGIVTTSNLSAVRLLSDAETEKLMASATLQDIASTIHGLILNRPKNFSSSGDIQIITLGSEDEALKAKRNDICILSSGHAKQIQLIHCGSRCLVITCGQPVSDEVLKEAVKYECAVISTQYDTMHTAKVITEAYTVDHVMTDKVIFFRNTEYVDDVAAKMMSSRVRSYPVLDEEGKIVGAVSRYHTQNYRHRQFVLVDHSARNQSISHIEDAEIQEIVDHHHIGDIETDYPINYRNQKCGCTCTIIANMYQENGLLPDADMSGLLLSAILSDTLNFKSATTTKQDIQTADWLAKRAGIPDISQYASELLNASVALKDSTPHEILNRDLKTYTVGRWNLAIGQTNYSHIEDIQALLPKFRETIAREQEEKKLDLMVMMFTHVMAEGTMFVYYGPLSYVVTDLLKTKFDDHFGYDPGIISRKQQLMPKLSSILKSMP